MKIKIYACLAAALVAISLLLTLLRGFTTIHLLDSLFILSMLFLCLGLLLYMFSDGAFSIMGHSFRRFHYVTAPKRLKETMADDELYNQKEVKIRNEKYTITQPMILTALAGLIISLGLSYLIK